MPTGIFLKIRSVVMIQAVPVNTNGNSADLWLKARIYPMPTTVPGTAKVSMDTNSMVARPINFFLITRNAINIPKIPVMGVASVERARESII
jgi:hypothetical protein